jgi:hypothetical protein
MAAVRTLKLNLLADTKNFSNGLNNAEAKSNSFSKKIGKNFAVAGAAIGAAAIALGIDAVKAAAADQKSQKLLSVALKNTTKATDLQVQKTEDWISATQFATGVADDELRPALARLVRSTGNVGKAQDLLKIALDVSAGSGKDLGTVTAALGKAYDGNLGALKKLGVPLSDTIIKNKDLAGAIKVTEDKFKGSSAAAAGTLAGKMAILGKRVGEAKESIGTAIIDALTPLAEKWLPKIGTGITNFVDGLTGKKGVADGAHKAGEFVKDFGGKIAAVFKFFKDNVTYIKFAAEYMALFWGAMKLASGASSFLSAMQKIIGVYKTLKNVSISAAIAEAFASEGLSIAGGTLAAGAVAAGFGVAALNIDWNGGGNYKKKYDAPTANGAAGHGYGRGGGGRYNKKHRFVGYSASDGNTYMIDENNSSGTPVNVFNLNGIVDAESARRTIQNLMQQSSLRTGPVNFVGTAL